MASVQIKDHHFEQRLFQRRMLVAASLIGMFAIVLWLRLAYLQILKHDYYMDLSQGNRARIEPIPANRGLILDRNGQVLAENQAAYQLELIREQVPDLNATLTGLADLGLLPREDLEDIRRLVMSRRGFEGVPIRLRMAEEEIARFAVHRYRFPGVDIRTRSTRSYPHGELAVHALGYVAAISEQDLTRIDRSAYAGTSLIGKLGVESARETELHGTNGFREILVNAQGRSVQRAGAQAVDLRSRAPRAGSDLVLSIDLKAQQVAEEALQGRRGSVVAMDPNTGDVLVLASHPGFDPSLFGRGLTRAEYRDLETDIDRPLFNRALRGVYPPGSTIKPAIALAGLKYNVVDPHDHRFCGGIYTLPGSRHQFREGRSGRHGSVDLEVAIAKSCDVYFYGLANEIGVDHLSEFLAPFGYGKITGIDISGEKSGLLPSREWKKKAFARPQDQVWFPGETVNFGIGQGFMSVTPMQQAHVISVIASRGKSFRPRLVTGLRDSETGEMTTVDPVKLDDVEGVPEKDWDTVFAGMLGTIAYGTGAGMGKGAQYSIAGKTGTAQVFTVAQNETYNASRIDERLRDHSWFVAFAPVEAPRIALVVLVENGGFGAAAAAPIARKVLDAYLLPPTPPVAAPPPVTATSGEMPQ